ncbi:MAG: hypothetical protein M3273_04545 [Actinomycetota bacterium]|nr:hypothetical protein [Actinomycetota bacterium]
MRTTLLARLRDQRGVALITVLFIGAALTAVAATSSFVAVRELRSSTEDWSGSRAISYGEAGLQRFLNELKLGGFGMGAIIGAGCTMPPVALPQGLIGDGSYSAELTVYNPDTTPKVPTWTGTPNFTGPCTPGTPPFGREFSNTKVPQLYAISSTGASAQGRRTVRSVVTVSGSGLPVGVFVNSIDANGNPDFDNISIFASGDIVGRDKIDIGGIDANYTINQVYGSGSTTQNVPAAIHAVGAIYGKGGGKTGAIHPPNPNCSVGRGPQGQSMWDSSGTGGMVTAACTPAWTPPPGWTGPAFPPTTRFTAELLRVLSGGRTAMPKLAESEYQALKATAKSSGLYCFIPKTGTAQCTKGGQTHNGSITDISGTVLPAHFVAYYDYEPGSNNPNLSWGNEVSPCPTRSATVVVRNGGVTLRGGGFMYGTILAPEGAVDAAGNYVVYGSVLANSMKLRGTAGFALDTCAVNNQPATTLNVSPGRWSEVDR